MNIPERKVEEVRSSVDIVDIISEHVQLKKRGRNFIGICPFHQEKTPSFIVSSEKQIYHCFGCHAGGNVFKFLMDYESISFIEAVQEIARKSGIILETEETQRPSEKQSEQEILFDINTLAAKFFLNNLFNNSEGESARTYFSKRNIKPQTQRIFGLGYALPGWDSFVNYAKMNRIDLEKTSLLGLTDKRDNGSGYYDKFRDRVIFPIFSPNGRVIAFGGRVMQKSDKAAKYLNSPESPVYFKRKTLYGLYHSKEEIRKLDKAILVEGYIDLISLYQNGIKNVVASCGTALTEEQAQMLARYTKNIIVFYDADAAGIKASIRSIEILVKHGFEVKIGELPQGEDPDSYVNSAGRQEFEEVIKRSRNFLEYQALQLEKQGKFNDPAEQTQALRELVHSVAMVNDELKRELLIKSIAKKFNLKERLLEDELENVVKSVSSSLEKTERRSAKAASSLPPKVVNPPKEEEKNEEGFNPEGFNPEEFYDESLIESKEQAVCPAEKELIMLLFEGEPKVIKYIFNNITPEDFSTPDFQYLSNVVFDAYTSGQDILPGALLDKIDEEEKKQFVLSISMGKYSISKTWDEINPGLPSAHSTMRQAKDSIKRLRIFRIDKDLEIKHHLLEVTKDEEEVLNLMKQIRQILEEKKMIGEA
ncbi:MAG: DNA primase [Bacteroidota bacterium]|nr:DNA primase [Bacteroidota bacterium]MDP4190079.1 DNA primase [Bacteroidota bacterium]MDP4193694.1 DNA primase [Bacteroidota bacterium]